HRIAAARAGVGTFGKNSLLYANRMVAGGSWVTPIPIMMDREFPPDEPTFEVGCPRWCKNACLTACPTGALKGPRRLDPRKCISFLTYFGEGLTPLELREPMGMWIYGCDRCQDVCPRNAPWLARKLPENAKVAAMVDDFSPPRLLRMSARHFNTAIFPHMFYMSEKDIWRWRMNAARAMGNSLDERFVPGLKGAFEENADARVQSMIAWALGRIGGSEAKKALEAFMKKTEGSVRSEIDQALSSPRL
ncbi:MAG: epoxyqueuosine reductase, partial [Desulfobacterales bacterium]|nr:epoxyqueuosine reductase [Desulfobacterales bacterium]